METPFELMYCLEKVAPFIHLPLYWADSTAIILGANQAFLDITGRHSLEEIRNKMPELCFPPSMANAIQEHVRQVVDSKQVQVSDQEIQEVGSKAKRYFTSTGSPVFDSEGRVFGVVVTTSELRAANVFPKNMPDINPLKNEEAMTSMAQKVAHDIQSPLSALSVMVNNCEELDEAKRLIFKGAVSSLNDIANNILRKYVVQEYVDDHVEERGLVLCSDFLLKLVSERKCQYQHRQVKFEVDISPNAQYSFVRVQQSQFGRALSNLISNAVDALSETAGAKIKISLDTNREFVTVQIIDNGKGMPTATLNRIKKRKSFTSGKKNGHGLGMMQVWDMVDSNDAVLTVTSKPGQGTTFELKFPRTEKANWVTNEINIRYDDMMILVDDDQLIHDAWDLRVKPFLRTHPELAIRHESNGQAAINYIASLDPETRSRVHLLCDFELVNQEMNGLQVIKASGVERALLITSYYHLRDVQSAAVDMGVKILPKQMALVTPFFCTEQYGIKKTNVDDVAYDKKFYDIGQTAAILRNRTIGRPQYRPLPILRLLSTLGKTALVEH